MARNFKIGELNESAIYSVSLIDNWDGHAEDKIMTGAELKSFTNAAAHLYDIHATEIKEDPAADVEKEEKKMFAMIEKNVREDHAKTATFIKEMRTELKTIPTWAQYERGGVTA